ncbi:Flagellar assembly protein FliH [Rubrivivax sp. A210]|uniref:FliH/SctL family protein n=1 Tax=Rubrivivax sp. A210 TaxID=2772301 RepID=UPI00191B365A|nr:flagellar assembly protein FliH [Rubrivivax sp. A210]CAD5373621.1 Flagellar assembly protein FliH [Rubrivivax sp. A210]
MTSSSKPTGFRNVPPPPGSKAGSAYTRFIPREELGDFASWKPGSFAGAKPTPAAPPAPSEPTSEEWRERVHGARQSGYQEGYRDGMAALEGFKQSFAQQATSQIGALLESFDRQFEDLDGIAAQALAQCAVQLARQVLRTELEQRPELVATIAGEAVQAVMMSARHINVHVHPLDLPLVAEGAEEVLTARGARLQADPTVARGGVMVQSDVGAIDARIAARWAQAAAALGSRLPLDDDGEEPSA